VIREKDVRMVKLLRTFDAAAMQAEVASITPEMISEHKQVPQGGRLMRDSTRYHTGGWKFVPFVEHGHADFRGNFPYLGGEVMAWFRAPVLRARIMILEPGHGINPHIGNLGPAEKVRYLLPITMPAGTTYYVEDEAFFPRPGEVWYLNQNKVHWVENKSSEARHVLAVDTPADHRWVRAIFGRVGVEL
jgi:hypothetical protein